MAEVTPTLQEPSTPPSDALLSSVEAVSPEGEVSKSKCGRHSRFSAEEDLIIVREVAASMAHIAAFGTTRKRFEAAAEAVNQNPQMRALVTWKSVQDRYKRLQEVFDKSDNANRLLSGVSGGEMGELDELLMTMREARDDLDSQKVAERMERKAIDDAKDRAGAALVAAPTKRRAVDGSDGAEEGESSERPASERKKRRVSIPGGNSAGEMERFGMHLREADMARLSFDRERLAFEKERYDREREEREQEREERRAERASERDERREEREASAKLEMEKFKLMMQAFLKK